jgi:hypothetical protein
VRRSYLLKAKTSKNVGIFVLALKRKKVIFFALFQAKHSKQRKSESEMSQKRKEKRKISIPVKV